MKKTVYILASLALLLFSSDLKAQEFLDEITKGTCTCVEELDPDLNAEEFQMRLGLCIFAAAEPYSKELEEELGFKMEDIQTKGEELGRLVGVRMVTICPGVIAILAQKLSGDAEVGEAVGEPLGNEHSLFFTGTVEKVENEGFAVLTITNPKGKIYNCYWLSYVETKFDISDGLKDLEGETVYVESSQIELFDPQSGEYRSFMVIDRLEVVE